VIGYEVKFSSVPCLRPAAPAIAAGPQTLQGATSGHKHFKENLHEF